MDDPTLAEVYRAVLRIEHQTQDVFVRVGMVEKDVVRLIDSVRVLDEAHQMCPILRPGVLKSVGATIDAASPWPSVKHIAIGIAALGGIILGLIEAVMQVGVWLHGIGWRK